MISLAFVVWELPFWIALLFWTLVPATAIGTVTYSSVPFRVSELLLLLLSGYYCIVIGIQAALGANRKCREYLYRNKLPYVFLLTVLYALISMSWSSLDERDYFPMAYTLAGTAAAIVPSLCLLAFRPASDGHRFLVRLTGYLSGVCLLYFVESYLGLGLRSVEGRELVDFGIQRVKGPLFEASTGHILIIPCLALSLSELSRSKSQGVWRMWLSSLDHFRCFMHWPWVEGSSLVSV